MQSLYYTSEVGTLYYLDNLPTEPRETIVFLHGFTGSSRDFLNLPSEILVNYRCLIPDLPGHGQTQLLETETVFNVCGQVALLEAWLKTLAVEKYHLFGYSMGGRLGLQFAVKNFHYLKSLILVSTTAGIDSEGERLTRYKADEKLAQAILTTESKDFIRLWLSQPLFQGIAEKGHDFVTEEVLRRMPIQSSGLASSLKYFSTGVMPAIWTQLIYIQTPTLVIAGSRDIKYLELASKLVKLIPNSLLEVLETTHSPLIESPDLFWQRVNIFLKQLPTPNGGKQ